MNRSFIGLLTGITCLAGINAVAFPATYTYSAIGSGTLGAASFTDVAFTITAIADTSQILNLGGGIFHLNDISSSVFITGLGTANFTSLTENSENQSLPGVGFADPIQDRAILFSVGDPSLATYDLSTSLGPISGTSEINVTNTFDTDRGGFTLTSAGDATFTASVAVPEASSTAVMLGLSLAALGGAARKLKPAV